MAAPPCRAVLPTWQLLTAWHCMRCYIYTATTLGVGVATWVAPVSTGDHQHAIPRLPHITRCACAVQSVEPQDIVLASRPKEAGKQGKAVQLVTNFFKANFQKVPPILHHDMRVERMQFDPETGVRPSRTTPHRLTGPPATLQPPNTPLKSPPPPCVNSAEPQSFGCARLRSTAHGACMHSHAWGSMLGMWRCAGSHTLGLSRVP